MSEVYKGLPGWEGIYEVSTHGSIRSVDRYVNGRFIPGRLMKQAVAKKALKVNLCTGIRSISKTFTVGHLVLITFVCDKPEGTRALHRDGNMYNNKVDNLYWG
jgi:hypothetical protein